MMGVNGCKCECLVLEHFFVFMFFGSADGR